MTRWSIPLLCLEGVPGLPGAPQDEAGLTKREIEGGLNFQLLFYLAFCSDPFQSILRGPHELFTCGSKRRPRVGVAGTGGAHDIEDMFVISFAVK